MEKWIAIYLITFIVYMLFIINITANLETPLYDLTDEQIEVFENPSNDIITLANRFLIMSSINTGFAFLGAITTIMTIVFIIVIALLINEFIPFT